MLAMQRDNNDDDKEKAGLCDLALSVVLKYEWDVLDMFTDETFVVAIQRQTHRRVRPRVLCINRAQRLQTDI